MHNRKIHNDMTKMMFPGISPKLINDVNHAIDNPSREMMMFNNAKKAAVGKNAFVLPGMYMGGHREYNHDMMSAMVAGWMKGGAPGMQAAAAHLMEDWFRGQMNRTLGYHGANMMESMWMIINGGRRRPLI